MSRRNMNYRIQKGTWLAEFPGVHAQIAALTEGQLWRHNQAGDLVGGGNEIDTAPRGQLVAANAGKRGFTYTHKPVIGENPSTCALDFGNHDCVGTCLSPALKAESWAELEVGKTDKKRPKFSSIPVQ